MKRILLALFALAAIASAACRQYDVDVYRNFNGRVRARDGVTESFTCTADSLLWAELFVGAANTPGWSYYFEVQTYPDGDPLYTGSASAGDAIHYEYVRAPLEKYGSTPLIKGEEYVLKVTIPNAGQNDSINWYADSTNPYPYGRMFADQYAPLRWDLCARVEGVNRAVSRELAEKPVSQPDLSVDSVWVAQGTNTQVTLRARVRNIGNKQFVAPRSAKGSCLRFCIDGERVNAVAEPTTLKVGGVATVQSVPVSPDRSIVHLVSAEANANKEVIEPNFDNNARYCPLSAR